MSGGGARHSARRARKWLGEGGRRSAAERDLQDCENADEGEKPAKQRVRQQRPGADALVVDVILDHHLQAKLHVPKHDRDEQDRHNGVERVFI